MFLLLLGRGIGREARQIKVGVMKYIVVVDSEIVGSYDSEKVARFVARSERSRAEFDGEYVKIEVYKQILYDWQNL